MNKIGFMQGRLVDQIDGKIQAFPWAQWQLEFPRAAALGLSVMEWTLDHERLAENPFVTTNGQTEIRSLMNKYNIAIPSVTGDCFMQAPFWKCGDAHRAGLLHELDLVLESASKLNVHFVVLPLVDNGKLQTAAQKALLITHLLERADFLRRKDMQIIFETDYAPADYQLFLGQLPDDVFNVNYDMGNSASLGFNSSEEFAAYGKRIVNVHVKDRQLGGTTVALGTGAVDFNRVFDGLAKLSYSGNFILQTARASNGDHEATLAKFIDLVARLLQLHYES
jgi:L-ribulose-5-phosphate 3-epimerase